MPNHTPWGLKEGVIGGWSVFRIDKTTGVETVHGTYDSITQAWNVAGALNHAERATKRGKEAPS